MKKLAGIDYGSKMAGTTVLAFWNGPEKSLHFHSSLKKKDADRFLIDHIKAYRPKLIALDAPLSLPGRLVHQPALDSNGLAFESYFYRRCDQHFKAMSPMFLGGLTARAIQLKDQFTEFNVKVLEAYPSALIDHLQLRDLGYKKDKADIPVVLDKIKAHFPSSFREIAHHCPETLPNWHHVDAYLCLLTATRIVEKQAEIFGDPKEGQIFV